MNVSELQGSVSFETLVGKITGWQIDHIIEATRNLGQRCIECPLLREEIKKISPQRTEKILDDVAETCPITSAYMGAVVSVCTVDQRKHQQRLASHD